MLYEPLGLFLYRIDISKKSWDFWLINYKESTDQIVLTDANELLFINFNKIQI